MRVFTKTFQMFAACNKILTEMEVGKLFHVGSRAAYSWSANPAYCQNTTRNPIDRLMGLLRAVQEMGRDEVVHGILYYIGDDLGYKVYKNVDAVKSDKGSVVLELLDINVALGELSEKTQESLKDFKVDAQERLELLESASALIRQGMEFQAVLEDQKDNIPEKGGESKRKGGASGRK